MWKKNMVTHFLPFLYRTNTFHSSLNLPFIFGLSWNILSEAFLSLIGVTVGINKLIVPNLQSDSDPLMYIWTLYTSTVVVVYLTLGRNCMYTHWKSSAFLLAYLHPRIYPRCFPALLITLKKFHCPPKCVYVWYSENLNLCFTYNIMDEMCARDLVKATAESPPSS